jgi:N-acetylglucosaminyldiphosphoundecaprenol N-acetyl-beta-D-mannosaminyltransferase
LTAQILGVRVDTLDRPAVLARCRDLMEGGRPSLVVTANALLILEAATNPDLAAACRDADVVTADGASLVWASRRLGQPALSHLPGIDLAFELCGEAAHRGFPVFLLGAAPGVAEAAAGALQRAHLALKIAGIRDGFFEASTDEAVLAEIQRSRPRLVLVALGTPKQEIWLCRLRDRLPPGLYIGVGGSFDIWAGRLSRAPRFVRENGFEWAYRLMQEPSRFRRMLRLPVFAWRVERARHAAK